MDLVQPSSFAEPTQLTSAEKVDSRTPLDYGTLGPGSDVDRATNIFEPSKNLRKLAPLVAVAVGVLAAMLVVTKGSSRPVFSKSPSERSDSVAPAAPALDSRQLDRMNPQKQAEVLLEQAIADSSPAVDQISSRVGQWQGSLQWNSQIATLTSAAMNSRDTRVRESAVEIELAAYGLSKNSASLNYLLKTADAPDHAQKIWALWALGLMGNRGVETGRVVNVLIGHLKDADEDSRRWAVEGLALAAADETLAPLLTAMHDDPSPAVRERAACSLADSGMFTREQRLSVIPKLLNYTDDPALDSQTHAWAFQALAEITHQHLSNDPAAWRNWYASQAINAQ